jgi:hypothetical protein
MADRRKMPTEIAIRRHWADDALWSKMGVEPPPSIIVKGVCMACGIRSGAQRSHITPRVKGGPDTVDNLHMLGGYCHHASELLEGKTYWRWIGRQNVLTSVPATFARFGMSLEKLRRLSDEQAAQFNVRFERVLQRTRSPLEAIDELEDIGVDIRL